MDVVGGIFGLCVRKHDDIDRRREYLCEIFPRPLPQFRLCFFSLVLLIVLVSLQGSGDAGIFQVPYLRIILDHKKLPGLLVARRRCHTCGVQHLFNVRARYGIRFVFPYRSPGPDRLE